MNQIRYGKWPSYRGWYLFVWGLVYLALSGLFLQSGIALMFVIMYGGAGVTCLISSWWHRLDPLAFSALVSVTAFRALWHLFDLSTQPGMRSLSFILWAGVGSTHFIISKWPSKHDAATLETLEGIKGLSQLEEE
jgi:hypothetical protein